MPRLIANGNQQTVWQWDQAEPFGVNAPNENPSSLGTFEFSLRFPGQYADKETNLVYNYFRDYDPALGRYAESDPLGLQDGANTYGYVRSNPLSMYDAEGLCGCDLGACVGRCIMEYGGDVALIALGIGGTSASVPYPGNK